MISSMNWEHSCESSPQRQNDHVLSQKLWWYVVKSYTDSPWCLLNGATDSKLFVTVGNHNLIYIKPNVK